ncbi:hypothetical protein AVEN_182361-1 [Araneus ventricosus]|uniref:Uncharacterized protein n=1 Tax=Araneus ventricosus TaxID=182803 RepID=A0A4Y2KS30_ARAVE|nr:hypothetical protein AVEN_182361-1 [Araneus ventricosus]
MHSLQHIFKVSAVHVEAGFSTPWNDVKPPLNWYYLKGCILQLLVVFVWWPCIPFVTTFARSYTVGFFPMGSSQGTGVSRRSDNTNGLSCSSACCLYFGGPRDAATCDDSHSTACSSLTRHARRTL